MSIQTLPDLLDARVASNGDSTAMTLLGRDVQVTSSISYSELRRMALLLSEQLLERANPDERVMICIGTHLEFAVAFWACMYARLIAVPVSPMRARGDVDGLAAIAADCGARLVIAQSVTNAQLLRRRLGALEVLCPSASMGMTARAGGIPPRASDDAVALLQYTSGSTGDPKGVVITHRCLLHNSEKIRNRFRHSASSRGLVWLPPYHDMGLVGGILQPLYAGFPVWYMATFDFIQKPLRWLQAISRYRATSSGGPNFAYEQCLSRIRDEACADLDLSNWSVAFNGAEPVRAQTLDGFAEKFSSAGFRRSAFLACYGMAEATLLISAPETGTEPLVVPHPKASTDVTNTSAVSAGYRNLVACGRCDADEMILIVDPESHRLAPQGSVGEIWVSSRSNARGYFRRDHESEATFAAQIVGQAGTFLRTGDLGIWSRGQLVIVGRLKELIIIRGQKFHPSDIEATVSNSHPALRHAQHVAFSCQDGAEEQLIVLIERATEQRSRATLEEIGACAREAIASVYRLRLQRCLWVEPAQIPRTPSGKPRRLQAKRMYEQRAFEVSHTLGADRTNPPCC